MGEGGDGLGPEHDLLCAGTLMDTPLLARVGIAARLGYHGVSVFTTDLDPGFEAGRDLAGTRGRIEDAGLMVGEIDPLMLWYPSAEPGPGFFAYPADQVLEMAEALGARSINAVAMAGAPTLDELCEAFAGLCRQAAERGLLVHIEFMPFSAVRSLADALRLVAAAGQPNGGIMLDVWHLARSGGTAQEVRGAAPRILAVQLDDAPAEPEAGLLEETLHHRRLPGDGDADVPALLSALREGGSSAPLGVEVFSDALAGLPDEERARLCLDAVHKVRAAAA